MKRLIISACATIAFLAAANTMLRSQSPSIAAPVGSAGTMSSQEFQTAAAANKLPIEDFEDQSLVFSTATKR
jgi:hypothetical protein